MKTAFLIDGFKMNRNASDPIFADLRKAIETRGYTVVPVPFFWNYTTVPKYVEQFVEFYENNKSDHNIIIGNSYGAMVAFLAAPIVKPDRAIICSLSPYFNEDKDKTTKSYRIKKFGINREHAMSQLSATKTAQDLNKTNVSVTLLYGEQEKELHPHLMQRVWQTAKQLKHAEVIEAPGAPHAFYNKTYIDTISSVLAK